MAKQIGSYDFKSAKLARDSIEVGGRNYARTNVDSGTSGTSNGVTFSVTGPSAVKINGTATATAAYGNTWFGGLTLEPGDYMLWLTNTNGGTIWFRLGTGSSNTHVYSTNGNYTRDNPYRFTVTTAATYQFGPVCAAGTYSNVETKFMLEKGTIPTEWSKAEEDVDAAIADGKIWYAECPTAADAVAKVATITPATTAFELKRGVMVNVYFSATNTGAVGSLTLNVNGTGAKPLRNYYNGGVSTLSSAGYLKAGSIITFRYDGTNWLSDLTVNSTYNMAQVSWNQPVIASSDTYTGTHIIIGDSGGYRNLAAGKTFDLGYPILYYATAASTTIASGSTANNHYLSINGVTFTTNGTITSGAANKTLYLKGTISGNVFTVAAAPFMTCTPPTSQDGYIYIPLGVMSSATAGRFTSSKDLYAYVDGAFRQVNPTDIVATQKVYYRSHVGGDVPVPTAWIEKNTDQYNTTVSGGNAGWSTKVTPIASTLNPTEAQKHLYLYTCEQRKRLDGTVKCTGRVSGSNTYALLDDSNTVIDGGKIITGSVTANQIAAGAVTAGKVAAGAITADKIAANAITIGMVNGLDTYVTGNLLGNTLNSAWNNVNISDAGNTYGSVAPYNTAGATRTIESYDTESNAVVLSNDTATGNRGVGWFTKAGAVKAGVKYTFSCLVWASVAVSVHTHTAWRSSAASAYEGWTSAGSKSISANTWTQYSYTFQPDSSAKLTWEFMTAICYTGQSGGVTFKVAHAKLEEGDEATSWYLSDSLNILTNKMTASYGTCGIAAATAAKVVTLPNFTLFDGAEIVVKFTYANVTTAPTLNVNNTGAIAIKCANSTYPVWSAGELVSFIYDGENWQLTASSKTDSAIKDVRSTNENPQWYIDNYPQQTVREFKQTTAIGLTGETYTYLVTDIPWVNSSGGWPKQTAILSGKQYWRVGTSGTAWGAWTDAYGTALNSANTANNYIRVSGEGIKIANANPLSATTYQHQTASSTDFYVSGKKRTSVSGNGLEVLDSDGETSVAKFGADARVGESEKNRIEITSGGIRAFDKVNMRAFSVISEGTVTTTENYNQTFRGRDIYIPASTSTGTQSIRFFVSLMEKPDVTSAYCSMSLNSSNASDTYTGTLAIYHDADHGYYVVLDDLGDAAYTALEDIYTNSGSFDYVTNVSGYLIYDSSTAYSAFVVGSPPFSNYGQYSMSQGIGSRASAKGGHAEGTGTLATGLASHSEGYYTMTVGNYAHAEGYLAKASGFTSHAEGSNTKASGSDSHAEGSDTVASGQQSHAEGVNCQATAKGAHAEGNGTLAKGNYSHASGQGTIAARQSQTVVGENNVEDTAGDYMFIVGNGTSSAANSRSNAFAVDADGNTTTKGAVHAASIGTSTTKVANGYFTKLNGYYPVMTNVASSGSYPGFVFSDGTTAQYIRTTTNGLLPVSADSTNGKSTIGTASWPFANGYFKKINGVTPVLTDTHGSLSTDQLVFTVSMGSIGANTSVSKSASLTVPSGYSLGGIYYLSTDQGASCGIVGWAYSQGDFTVRVRNYTSSAKTVTVTAKFQYLKVT